ncbi:MAG TPA: S53 family peptidase [Pseudonocardiaceae bacterium]|nr:S53 family peptidase [Pseudonocardiaceae bacterium]
MTQAARIPLAGSHRAEIVGAEPVGRIDPGERIEFTVILRRRAALPDSLVVGPDTIPVDELARLHGADPADVELVREVLGEAGATIVEVHAGSRRIRASGPESVLHGLFGVELSLVRSADPWGQQVEHRARSGELELPERLAGVVLAVLGLDNRPQARTRSRRLTAAAGAPAGTFAPPALAPIYGFPGNADGTGQTAAVIELGGGYAQQDLDTYFQGLNIPTPTVKSVGVDGASNGGGKDPNGSDGEVLLDIEVLGGLAPKTTQVVYFAPNTDSGFVDAVSTAVHASPTPTVVSISWGQSEDQWTAQSRTALDQAFADAAALGVTITTAAGDNGSGDNVTDGVPHADFPASSPHALACGGTSLVAAAGKATSETVWNDTASGGGATGGGVSDAFPLPSWQAKAGVPNRATSGGGPGRGVPDVAGDADPQTGYQVRVDGSDQVYGGTSAVAPLWAALICRLAQLAGKKFGLLQPLIYAGVTAGAPAAGFRDITTGNNSAYTAGNGWDACTGLGVPDGTTLLGVLTK